MGSEWEPRGHLTMFINSDALARGVLTFMLEHQFSQDNCLTPWHTLPALQETFVAETVPALLESTPSDFSTIHRKISQVVWPTCRKSVNKREDTDKEPPLTGRWRFFPVPCTAADTDTGEQCWKRLWQRHAASFGEAERRSLWRCKDICWAERL